MTLREILCVVRVRVGWNEREAAVGSPLPSPHFTSDWSGENSYLPQYP